MKKKIFSYLLVFSLLISNGFGVIINANALGNVVVPVKSTIIYSNNYNGFTQGELVTKDLSSGGIPFNFQLYNPSGIKLCEENKTLGVINGLMSYDLGSQYLNTGGATGCNIYSLGPNTGYTIKIYGDITNGGNNSFSDIEDFYTTANYTSSIDDVTLHSFLDSKTFQIQQDSISKLGNLSSLGTEMNLGLTNFGDQMNQGLTNLSNTLSGGLNVNGGISSGGTTADITYNAAALDFSSQMMAQGALTKNFDLNKDGINEIFVKRTGENGRIYIYNTKTNGFEPIYIGASVNELGMLDSYNAFFVGKEGNFVLYYSVFNTNSNVQSNISVIKIDMDNNNVVSKTSNVIVKEWLYGKYAIVNINGKDIKFIYNGLNREYQEQFSTTLGSVTGIYDSITSSQWNGTPFSSESAIFYGTDVKEAEINGNTITNIDGIMYGDFNNDNKLDYISYTKNSDGTVNFTISLQKSDGSYKNILESYKGDNISIGDDIITGDNLNEIVISNGDQKTILKLNNNWIINGIGIGNDKTVSQVAQFNASFYYILGTSNSFNESFVKIDSNFRDMNDSNKNDKFLLIGSLKTNDLNGYKYYNYQILKYNGSQFIPLIKDGETSGWKGIGNKIGFRKIGTSGFYIFYLDKSVSGTNSYQDKTELYYIHGGKIYLIMNNVITNDINVAGTNNGGLLEGGEKLLNGATFGFFGKDINNITSGILSLVKDNYISSFDIFNSIEKYKKGSNLVTLNMSPGVNYTFNNVFLNKINTNLRTGPNWTCGTSNLYNPSTGEVIYYYSLPCSTTEYTFQNGDVFSSSIGIYNNTSNATLSYFNSIKTQNFLFDINGKIQNFNDINYSIDGNLIFGKTLDFGTTLKIDNIFKNNEKGLVYDSIYNINFGIGYTNPHIGGGRINISNYISKTNFIDTNSLLLTFKSDSEVFITGNNITDIGIASYGTNSSKHNLTNLTQPNNTSIWGALKSGYLYLDNIINDKVIYFDNGGIGFINKNILSEYGGSFKPYLDSGNYFGKGINNIVFGNQNKYNNSCDTTPGTINKTLTIRVNNNSSSKINFSNSCHWSGRISQSSAGGRGLYTYRADNLGNYGVQNRYGNGRTRGIHNYSFFTLQ